MLLVKTKLKDSPIHGIGLFADQIIEPNDIVWKFESNFDIAVDMNVLESLPKIAKICFAKYGYLSSKTGLYILDADDARFFNHSDQPNCRTIETAPSIEDIIIALKPINVGEELTINYSDQEHSLNNNLLTRIYTEFQLVDENDPRIK
jgi:SET domain-containing protein